MAEASAVDDLVQGVDCKSRFYTAETLVEMQRSCAKSFFKKEEFSLKKVELLRTVGTGTFGRVMVVREKETNRFYALKIMVIEDILKMKQIEHVLSEKKILDDICHPFIVDLYWTKSDIKFLYMLLEYACGGELFTYLRSMGKFPDSTAMLYSAEIVSAISYLHSLSIVYRDLKPENLLLDDKGHIKITDFGFAKYLSDRTYTMCGTPEYLAPEIIQGKGYNKAVDWWALGILMFEMLTGNPPFSDDNPMQIYQKILNNKFEFPKQIDSIAKDLIKKLLVADRMRRLGNMKGGAEDVMRHRWFRSIDWNDLLKRKIEAPIFPNVTHPGDTRCYDNYDEQDWRKIPPASAKSQELFRNF